jgi:hypothetical protein
LHLDGGCSFARHGTYGRVTPQGLRIARWYCPQGHRTFSLLPDFMAARLPGLLTAVDAVVAVVEEAGGIEKAVDLVRGFEVSLPSALRWIRRRVNAVKAVVDTLSTMVVWPTSPLAPTNLGSAIHQCRGNGGLFELRRSLAPQFLHALPAPVGFMQPLGRRPSCDGNQHDMGPDIARDLHYGSTVNAGGLPCHTRPPERCHPPPPQQSSRHPQTCFVHGGTTAAFRTAAPAHTFCG